MPTVLVDWRPTNQAVIYSNLTFDRSINGASPRAAVLEYSNAVTWKATSHFVPVFELIGSTNTITGRTQQVALPG
jgi:hypothetical protein